MSSNGSFYQNGLPLSTAETGLGNVPTGAPVPNKASSSFYLAGSAYDTLKNADVLLADITAQQVLATAAAAASQGYATASSGSATASAASAASAAASLATLLTTSLLKANNLSDLTSVSTAKVNLALDQVTNTSDINKPVSTAQATADALVASNAAAATALKANIASPALTGTPSAPTAAALTNTTQLATTAYADAAVSVLSGTTTSSLALKAPLASPALTGVPTAPTAAPGVNTTQLATTAFVEAARVILAAADALKAPLASPSLTGVPTAPTAAVDTNTTQLATTAMVLAQAASATPLINGTTAVGTSTRFARGDHVHPTDTSRAPLASPGLTGTPTAPTATPGTNTTQLATAAFVQAKVHETTLSVFDFGAVGNGVADDTAAINATIAAAVGASNKTIVEFPPGTYRVTSTVTVSNSNIILKSQHIGKAIIYRDFVTGPTISFIAALNALMNSNGVIGFSFTRNLATTPATSDVAMVKATACNNFYFEDIQADNVVEGLQLVGGAFFYVSRVNLTGQHGALGGSRFGLKSEKLSSPGTGAVVIPSYLWMDKSYFSGPLNAGFGYALWITCGENWNIDKTYFGQAFFHNILIEQGTDNAVILDIRFDNCYVDTALLDGVHVTGSGVLSAETWGAVARTGGNGSVEILGIAISNTSIKGNATGGRNGVQVDGGTRAGTFTQAMNGLTLSTNFVSGWLGSGVRIDGGVGIVTTGNTICGNNYSNSTGGVGLLIGANVSNVSVTGNRIGGDANLRATAANQPAGINIVSGCSNYVVTGNDVSMNPTPINYGSVNGLSSDNVGDFGAIATSFIPVVTAGSGTYTTATAVMQYRRISRDVVWISVTVSCTTVGTAATSTVVTVPFAAAAFPQMIFGRENALTGVGLQGLINPGATTINITKSVDNSFSGGTGASLIMTGTYICA